jgi:hypothetical protein
MTQLSHDIIISAKMGDKCFFAFHILPWEWSLTTYYWFFFKIYFAKVMNFCWNNIFLNLEQVGHVKDTTITCCLHHHLQQHSCLHHSLHHHLHQQNCLHHRLYHRWLLGNKIFKIEKLP